MKLNMIVCVAKDNLIGDANPTGNGLLWHSKEELRYFKEVTSGNVVVFGENTAKVVPIELMKKDRDVEVLKLGENTVMSIMKKYADTGKDIFICGGYSVYKSTLDFYDFDEIYVSKLKEHVEVKHAENPLYFPDLENLGYVKVIEDDQYEDFVACVYKR